MSWKAPDRTPIAMLPWRASRCPRCERVFEPSVLICAYCECATRLYSPTQEHVADLSKKAPWCGEESKG